MNQLKARRPRHPVSRHAPPGQRNLCPVRESGFCPCLDREGSARLEALGTRLQVPAGELVVEEGRVSDDILCVIDGVLMLSKSLPDGRRQVTRFCFAGDLASLPRSGVPSCVTVRSVTPARLCRLNRRAFRRFCESHPEAESHLLDMAGGEIAAAHDHMLLLGRKSATERVAWFLVEFGRRAGRPGPAGREIRLPMSRRDVADYLGLEVETVCRILARLKSAGLLALPRPSRVVLMDGRTLNRLAGAPPGRARCGFRRRRPG